MAKNHIFIVGGLCACLTVGFAGAWFFRFEPIPELQDEYFIKVWDRWGQRFCLAPRPGISDVNAIACGATAYQTLLARIGEEQKIKDKMKKAGQKNIQENGQEVVRKLSQFVSGLKDTGADNVIILRNAGFSEHEIAVWVKELRTKMLNAGAPKNLVDEYFGGDPYMGAE